MTVLLNHIKKTRKISPIILKSENGGPGNVSLHLNYIGHMMRNRPSQRPHTCSREDKV
jgi:hypothetical protein